MEQFLRLFFNEGETFCVSPNKYAYHSVGMDSFINNKVELISPNEKVAKEILPFTSMSLLALNPINGFRNDANCTAFRNFLIEMDDGTPEEQMEYIKNSKIPYSCVVFSGNKSLHFGIAMEQDFGSLESYLHVSKWLLNIMKKADQQTGNPSRSIRIPNAVRADTGKEQRLIEIKKRVSMEDLYFFLSQHIKLKPKKEEKKKMSLGVTINGIPTRVLDIWAIGINEHAAKTGDGRNQTWFKLFADLGQAGLDLDKAIEVCEPYFEPQKDFKRSEWETTAKSGVKHGQKGTG